MNQPLRVSGAVNLRDIGGLPAGNGASRHGVLLRSGSLGRLDEAGRDALLAWGLRRIIDLRDDEEVTREPSRLDDRLPVPQRVPLFFGSADSFFVNDISLDELYRHLVVECDDRIATVARGVLAERPVLIHCTAGKDRTGVIVALLLSAAGVERAAVVADYARTAAELSPERNRRLIAWLQAAHPHAQHVEELVALSPAVTMANLLDEVDHRYGSAADYLRSAGLSDDEVDALRRALVADEENPYRG